MFHCAGIKLQLLKKSSCVEDYTLLAISPFGRCDVADEILLRLSYTSSNPHISTPKPPTVLLISVAGRLECIKKGSCLKK
jgi:hypothetical protein